MRPMILLLIVCLTAGLCTAAESTTTQADIYKCVVDFNRRTLVDDYQRIGRHDPKWDELAIAFLEAMALHFARDTAHEFYVPLDHPTPAILIDLADKAVAAGCDDPILLYCKAQLYQDLRDSDQAKNVFTEPYPLVLAADYHPYWKYRAATLIERCYVNTMNELERSSLIRWQDEFINFIKHPTTNPLELRWRYKLMLIISESRYTYFYGSYMKKVADNLKDFDPWLQSCWQANGEIDLAWRARGKGWAGDVKPEGWLGFEEHIKLARIHALKAYELRPEFPEAATHMITICMAGGGVGDDTESLWFDRAINAQIDHFAAWHKFLWASRPRWGGSYDKMFEIGCRALETKRFDTRVPWLFAEAMWDISHDHETDWSTYTEPEVWLKFKAVVDGYLASKLPGIDPIVMKSRKAVFAYRCEQFGDFLAIHDQLGNKFVKAEIGLYGFKDAEAVMVSRAATSDCATDVRRALNAGKNVQFKLASEIWNGLISKLPKDHPAAVLAADQSLLTDLQVSLAEGKVTSFLPKTSDGLRTFDGYDPAKMAINAEGSLCINAKDFGLQMYIRHRVPIPINRRTTLEFRSEPNRIRSDPTIFVLLQDMGEEGELNCRVHGGLFVYRGEDLVKSVAVANDRPKASEWHTLVIEQRDGLIRVLLDGTEYIKPTSYSGINSGLPLVGIGYFSSGAIHHDLPIFFRKLTVEPLDPVE